MAGLTTFLQFENQGSGTFSPDFCLKKTIAASHPLPQLKEVQLSPRPHRIAMGGTFPSHYHRRRQFWQCGRKTLLFYGELYKRSDGREEAQFALEQIVRDGDGILASLNGPFALFMWDDELEELTIATDRLGRFPIFYSEIGEQFFFTSDLHAVLSAKLFSIELRTQSLVDLLAIGFPLGDHSFFRGIKRMSGGEAWKLTRSGSNQRTYWASHFSGALGDLDMMGNSFRECALRAVESDGESAITLSGGWDSRATLAAMGQLENISAITYGVRESADVDIATRVSETLGLPHIIAIPDKNFFEFFSSFAEKAVLISSGHATADIAFQIYVYGRLRARFTHVIDSAGCEFRRGIRARRVAKKAQSAGAIADFLLGVYSPGVWKGGIITPDFYRHYSATTKDALTELCSSYETGEEMIDAFSTRELWSHHYAHGYALQTHFIGCRMPWSDNEFHDLYSQALPEIRWSHRLHRHVINRYFPQLQRIPISHGHCAVPYGESMLRYFPMLYHRGISELALRKGLSALRALDNYRPFLPYHLWYGRELREYVHDNLMRKELSEFLNVDGVRNLLTAQENSSIDHARATSMLLTLSILLNYRRTMNAPTGWRIG